MQKKISSGDGVSFQGYFMIYKIYYYDISNAASWINHWQGHRV